MNYFPPNPSYPLGYDTDYTLFKVYNTTESVITADNFAWSDEIPISPVAANACEIWANNGYATLSGELLYYDGVGLNANGKVNLLKRCLRNLGGAPTQFNLACTSIRSFVVAEHHQQISQAIQQIENFIGFQFNPNQATLDWRIRNLAAEPIIFDDTTCPNLTLNFNILSSDPSTGTVANYLVVTNGSVGNFTIQFGDGSSSTSTSGTHTYAPNANIDPVITATTQNCNVVQGMSSTVPSVTPPVPPFFIPVPIPPVFPPFVFPNATIPSVDTFIPPIVLPAGGGGNVPSTINFNPPNPVPSQVNFGPVPKQNPVPYDKPPKQNSVSFGPAPNIPTIISFGPAPSICFCSLPKMPCVSVCWGKPPLLSVVCPTSCAGTSGGGGMAFDGGPDIQYEFGAFPETIRLDHELPDYVELRDTLPREIRMISPEIPIPTEIRMIPPDKDTMLKMMSLTVPDIKIDASAVPTSIRVECPELPKIIIDASAIPKFIKVTGIPDVIKVEGFPEFIDIRASKPIEMVYNGPPISTEVRIVMDVQKLIGDPDTGFNCVAIVPCNR